MNVIRFNPFAEVTAMRDQINRMLDDMPQPRQQDGGSGPTPRLWAPPVDVSENANDLTVSLDLPGVSREGIDLQLTSDTLVIRGERPFVRQEGAGYLHLERPHGTFQRSFNLSVPIQPDGVTATFKDGVLTIVLPKQEAVKPRKVEIRTDNQG